MGIAVGRQIQVLLSIYINEDIYYVDYIILWDIYFGDYLMLWYGICDLSNF